MFSFFNNLKIGAKIQIAIFTNVILAILIGEYLVTRGLNLTGGSGIVVNLLINGIIATIYGFFASKTITRPLLNIVDILKIIARGEGDLTRRLPIVSKDETGELSIEFNAFLEKLHDLIVKVKQAGTRVASGSKELSVYSEQILSGITMQSEKTAQVAASATEMSGSIADIAANASSIADSSSVTLVTAQDSAGVVDKTVNEVNIISDSVSASSMIIKTLGERSAQIGEIVNVINDIADQTNLLALNAAIEAARAGEQGRGFAVVADEVRKLAEKTAVATTEITDMIKAIQNESEKAIKSMSESRESVNSGVEFSVQAGEALQKIVSTINEFQTMVNQIATSTEEMTNVSEQIHSDIEGIATVSNDNSSKIDQMSHSLSDLAVYSENLLHLVDQFKLNEGFLQWNEELSVNIGKIDSQHKTIVGMINDLYRLMETNDDKGKVRIINGMVEYVANHFRTEEALMKTHSYPEYEMHKKEHDQLTKEVLGFQKDLNEGKTILSYDLLDFLKNWLSEHILGTDKKYGPFLNERNVY